MNSNSVKNVLITGGSRGIGEAVSRKYSKEGWNVITPTRDELDLLSDESIEKYIKSLELPVSVIINNAGINPISLIRDIKFSDIHDTINVNVISSLKILSLLYCNISQAPAPRRVVNICSIWGVVGKPGRAAYSIAKTGIIGLTRTAALEWADHDILVNSVAPGYTMTELTRKNNSESDLEEIRKKIPLGRLADPSEIATTIYFLGSEMNTYITGQTIVADGGYSCN